MSNEVKRDELPRARSEIENLGILATADERVYAGEYAFVNVEESVRIPCIILARDLLIECERIVYSMYAFR